MPAYVCIPNETILYICYQPKEIRFNVKSQS